MTEQPSNASNAEAEYKVESVPPVPELQWQLLTSPENIRKLARQRRKEELLELAEQLEYENSLRDRMFEGKLS